MTIKDKLLLIKIVLSDKERKSILSILNDLKKLKKKNSFGEMKFYVRTLMYKKDAGNINMYVNDSVLSRILKLMTTQDNWFLLDNKIKFSEIMRELPIGTPLYLGKIEKGFLYDNKGNSFAIKNKKDLLPVFDKLIQNHNTVFIKSAERFGGKGVFMHNKTSAFNPDKIDLQEDYLIEKGLIQHDALNKINPYCVNTLRVISLNRNGEIKIPSCLLRMGVNESYKDNASSGGIFVNYDIEKNKLGEVATKFLNKGGASFYSHPGSNFIFKDQSLPYPNEVISIVTKATKMFPDRYIIGWDVAYTPEGPVIIEGNTAPCPAGMQIALRGLRNNKIYDGIYREFYN